MNRVEFLLWLDMTCFEERRVVWFVEVLTVWKNGSAREACNEDPRGGCV